MGLMLGEERGVQGVVVKQLVPRGSADRTGVVRVGDQLLSVGDEDVSHQTVSNMRHLIIGRLLLTTVIRKKDKDLEVNVIVSKGRLCPKENSAAQGW